MERKRLRLHHLIGVYYRLCLSEEELKRTTCANGERVYGKKTNDKFNQFYEGLLSAPDGTLVELVPGFDMFCEVCPKQGEGCRMPDEERHYNLLTNTGIGNGDILTISNIKKRLRGYYPKDKAYYIESVWQERERRKKAPDGI